MNDREKLILESIIKHYLEYGESIGSRTLEKKYGIGVSSATIRNTMSDLEEQGLIAKTHTSSGRVPTNEGYKLYIEELIKIREITIEEKEKVTQTYKRKMHQLDNIFEETSKLLSMMSEYAGIVLEPSFRAEKIQKVELIHINDRSILLVVITNSYLTKTSTITLKTKTSEREIRKLSLYLNTQIKNSKISITMSELEEFLIKTDLFKLEKLSKAKNLNDVKVFFEGTTNLLDSKIADSGKTINSVKLLNSPEDIKQIFSQFINTDQYKDGEVNVVFGENLGVPDLEDLSFVFSVYTLGNGKGIIGVIGPKRMQYSKTVGLVEYVSEEVNKLLHKNKSRE